MRLFILIFFILVITGCGVLSENKQPITQNQSITIKLYLDDDSEEIVEVIRHTPSTLDQCGLFDFRPTVTRPPEPTINDGLMNNPDYVIDVLLRRVSDLNSYIDRLLEDYQNQYNQFLRNCIN